MILRSLAMAALLALAVASPAAAQTVLDKAVVSTGGGASTSTALRVDATIAEPVTGVATNGTTVGQFGFWAAEGAIVLLAGENRAGAITAMRLAPNPATDALRVTMSLAGTARVEISLHDATGQTIGTRSLGRLDAGEHVIPVDLAGLTSGSYSLVASIDGAMLRLPVSIVR